ncbi:uncharacterized protein [Physcomitrium patens]|nr:uncharacterized protein LOC112277326 [Physcomitrium patens]|eukprot:XP_024365259.1 uncharacterized protein LOC112277326 [Physcomitrella patens]
MEHDCDEGLDLLSIHPHQDIVSNVVIEEAGSSSLVRAGNLREDNHRLKARRSSEFSRLWTTKENLYSDSDELTTSGAIDRLYPKSCSSSRRSVTDGMCYSRIVRTDNFIPGKDIFEDWARSINVSEDGTLYVIAYKSTRQIINVSVYTSNENFATFAYLDYPQSTYELILGVEEAGCNDMLFIGARPAGADFFEGATSIIAWRDKKFLCVIVSPTPNAMRYYTNISEASSGFLYFGCSDGTIEVWKPHHTPNQGYVFVSHLNGHRAPVHKLVVDKFDTLYSVDVGDESHIRVWRNFVHVATVNLGCESVQTIACTSEGRLYVSTKSGEIMWRGMVDLLPDANQVPGPSKASHGTATNTGGEDALRGTSLHLKQISSPMSSCCKFSFEARVATAAVVHEMAKNSGVDGGGNGPVMLGSEILRPLYRPEGYIITNTCGCTILPGSEVMIMVTTEETFSIQAWYGNVCIAKLNTGLKFNQFQTLDCAKDGTLYGLVNDNIYIWKLV